MIASDQSMVLESPAGAKVFRVSIQPIHDEQGKAVMAPAEITVRVGLGRGVETATVWTCDFSYDYVKINADYRS